VSQPIGINIGSVEPNYIKFDRGARTQIKQRVRTSNLGGTYEERVVDGINNIEETINVSFTNRSYDEISSLSDFFDEKSGIESFLIYFSDPSQAQQARTVPVICLDYNIVYVNSEYASLTAQLKKVTKTGFNDDVIYQNFTNRQIIYDLTADKTVAVPGETITFTLNAIDADDNALVNVTIANWNDYTLSSSSGGSSFLLANGTGTIAVTIDEVADITDPLPGTLTLFLTEYPTQSLVIDIERVEPQLPDISISTESTGTQTSQFVLKDDGSFTYSTSNEVNQYWLNSLYDFNPVEWELFIEPVTQASPTIGTFTPAGVTSGYVAITTDITADFSSSIADGDSPINESYNLKLRNIADPTNEIIKSLTISHEAPGLITYSYTMELLTTNGTANTIEEGNVPTIRVTASPFSKQVQYRIFFSNQGDFEGGTSSVDFFFSGEATVDVDLPLILSDGSAEVSETRTLTLREVLDPTALQTLDITILDPPADDPDETVPGDDVTAQPPQFEGDDDTRQVVHWGWSTYSGLTKQLGRTTFDPEKHSLYFGYLGATGNNEVSLKDLQRDGNFPVGVGILSPRQNQRDLSSVVGIPQLVDDTDVFGNFYINLGTGTNAAAMADLNSKEFVPTQYSLSPLTGDDQKVQFLIWPLNSGEWANDKYLAETGGEIVEITIKGTPAAAAPVAGDSLTDLDPFILEMGAEEYPSTSSTSSYTFFAPDSSGNFNVRLVDSSRDTTFTLFSLDSPTAADLNANWWVQVNYVSNSGFVNTDVGFINSKMYLPSGSSKTLGVSFDALNVTTAQTDTTRMQILYGYDNTTLATIGDLTSSLGAQGTSKAVVQEIFGVISDLRNSFVFTKTDFYTADDTDYLHWIPTTDGETYLSLLNGTSSTAIVSAGRKAFLIEGTDTGILQDGSVTISDYRVRSSVITGSDYVTIGAPEEGARWTSGGFTTRTNYLSTANDYFVRIPITTAAVTDAAVDDLDIRITLEFDITGTPDGIDYTIKYQYNLAVSPPQTSDTDSGGGGGDTPFEPGDKFNSRAG
jgi:phage-related protein